MADNKGRYELALAQEIEELKKKLKTSEQDLKTALRDIEEHKQTYIENHATIDRQNIKIAELKEKVQRAEELRLRVEELQNTLLFIQQANSTRFAPVLYPNDEKEKIILKERDPETGEVIKEVEMELYSYWIIMDGRYYKAPILDSVLKKYKDKLILGKWALIDPANNMILGIVSDEMQEKLSEAGQEVTVDEIIDERRIRVMTHMDEKMVIMVPETMPKEVVKKIRINDKWLMSNHGPFLAGKEALPKSEIGDLLLEEVPDITYEKIGGLTKQIEIIREEIEYPFVYKEHYAELKLEPSKGILLYGPPGCGKTLLAKGVVNSLAERITKILGQKVKGYFINIKGPELLNKWVGETERKIREIFQKAREKANENCPVVIFLDEADSVLRTRGSGVSSDIEITNVAQFLAEMDGMETNKNVLLILATNRSDLIDPAVLRPGRVDVKVKIERPDENGARQIFKIYLTHDLPYHAKYFDKNHKDSKEEYSRFNSNPELIVEYMIDETIKRLWATNKEPYEYKDAGGAIVRADNGIVRLILANGDPVIMYLKDFISGAMIKNIVDNGKKCEVRRFVEKGPEEKGLMTLDLCMAVEREMRENEELPNTLNPEDAQKWLAIQGRSERIVHVEPLRAEREKKQREVERVINTGQYL